ncbi:MAG: hypothetical protein M0Q38_01260 [Bacteroidales bacterium]|jgi:hypothetical protein|nr:hypothetical protein [Bacteroidales bacterium]
MHASIDQPFIFHLLGGVVRFIFIFGGAFFLLWYYLKYSKKLVQSAITPDVQNILLPLKLQAYERFVLFLERIHPSNLVMRLNNPDLTSGQLQSLLVRTIREEFEYNLSQQLYVSTHTWELIKNAKEEMVALINKAFAKTGDQLMANDLVKTIFEDVIEKGKLPSELALDEIKKEVKNQFPQS